jgi:hypothetical protein
MFPNARTGSCGRLDRVDARRVPRELDGQPTVAGADLDDEVVARDAGVAHELRRHGAAAQEMLTVRPFGRGPSGARSRAHGPSPR